MQCLIVLRTDAVLKTDWEAKLFPIGGKALNRGLCRQLVIGFRKSQHSPPQTGKARRIELDNIARPVGPDSS